MHDLGYHVVWCPKYRRPVLAGPVKDRCETLLRVKSAGHGRRIITLGIVPDHVHLVVEAHPKHSPSYIGNQFKGYTSRTLRTKFPHLRSRLPTLWSRSCLAATTRVVSAAAVRRYIDTQDERPWRTERAR